MMMIIIMIITVMLTVQTIIINEIMSRFVMLLIVMQYNNYIAHAGMNNTLQL